LPAFVEAVVEDLRKYLKNELRWLPVTLVRPLNGKHTYVIYCFPNDLVENPSLTRVLTTVRISQEVLLVEEPPIKSGRVIKFSCEPLNLKADLQKVNAYLEELEDKVTLKVLRSDRLLLTHILSPIKWVLGDLSKVQDYISVRIASSIVKEIVAELSTLTTFKTEAISAYLLHAFNISKKEIYTIYNNQVFKNKTLSALVFNNSRLLKFFEVSQ